MVLELRKECFCDVYLEIDLYKFFWKEVWLWFYLVYLFFCFIIIICSNIVFVI